MICNRRTELTREQRTALAEARRLLSPLFAGQTLNLYVPEGCVDAKVERERRIRAALEQGEPASVIARREGVSDRYVRALRGRFVTGARGTVHP
jgi:hypothetical protein